MDEIKQNESLLEFKLDMLKTEINQIHDVIARLDKTSQQIKYWTIGIWSGSISLVFAGTKESLNFEPILMILIVAILLLFWLFDSHATYKKIDFANRNKVIGNFINDSNLEKSFETRNINFNLFDKEEKNTR